MRGYLLGGVIAGVVISLAGAGWFILEKGRALGIAECQAERVEAAEETQEAIDLRDRAGSLGTAHYLDILAATIPSIQVVTDEASQRVVVQYRDRVVRVGADCSRPGSVQAELNEARKRANGT